MSSGWYYSRDGKNYGPVSSAELKKLAADGVIRRTDHLWKDGMPEWQSADSLQGLFPPMPNRVAASAAEIGPPIVINTGGPASRKQSSSRSGSAGKRGGIHRPTHAKARGKPDKVLGIRASTWLGWLPWWFLLFGLACLLQAVVMRFTVIFANTWLRGIRMPPGVAGLSTVEEPLSWTLTFYACLAQIGASLVAFPLLRRKSSAGWTIAVASAVTWALLGLAHAIEVRSVSLFSAVPFVVDMVIVFLLARLRPHYA